MDRLRNGPVPDDSTFAIGGTVTRHTMNRHRRPARAEDHHVAVPGPGARAPDPTGDGPALDKPALDKPALDSPSRNSRSWVAADPFRALLRHLLTASQLPVHHLAVKVGLSTPLCVRLLADPCRPPGLPGARPIQRIPRDLAEQLMRTDAVSLCAELDVMLSAHRARATIRDLLTDGHRLTTLARITGLPVATLDGLAAGTTTNCTGRVDTALHAARVWAETHPAVDAPVRRPQHRVDTDDATMAA